MDFDLPSHYGKGLSRNGSTVIGTPIPRRPPERGLRIFSPPPPNPPVPFGVLRALPLFDEIGLDQHELRRLLLDRSMAPRVFAPIARSSSSEPEPEPYDVRMTDASARPRLGFTFDFEQAEEEEKVAPARVRIPVKFKQTIEIPNSPPPETMEHKGKGKAKTEDVEPEDLVLSDPRHKEVIGIYSDDEDMGSSIASSSRSTLAPATKITSVLICAGCRRPLRTGGDRLWALRYGHMIDWRCYNALSRPQFSSLPLLARLGSPPPGPAAKR
ncbi:lipase ATG15, putative, partial [Rhizoctonia solani AG-3 Rhs1AP]